MIRHVSLDEISDGRLYTSSDLVKADCQGCDGCSACCRGMGNSVVLDPWDIWMISRGTGKEFDGLLSESIELHLTDGMILPSLKMGGEEERCMFLNDNQRCGIHPYRPGICRLFPLGRFYEEKGFRYFLQVHECKKKDRSKIKVKKWLDIPELKTYETYIFNWHDFLKICQKQSCDLDQESLKILQMYLIRTFYQMPYGKENFYEEFYARLAQVKEKLGL